MTSVEAWRELLRVVVVAHTDAALSRPIDDGVEPLGGLLDLVSALPAIGSDHRIDEDLDAELGGIVEDRLEGWNVYDGVAEAQLIGKEGSMPAGSAQSGGIQRGTQFGSAADEPERLHVAQADLRQLVEGAGEICLISVSDRVQLDGQFGR